MTPTARPHPGAAAVLGLALGLGLLAGLDVVVGLASLRHPVPALGGSLGASAVRWLAVGAVAGLWAALRKAPLVVGGMAGAMGAAAAAGALALHLDRALPGSAVDLAMLAGALLVGGALAVEAARARPAAGVAAAALAMLGVQAAGARFPAAGGTASPAAGAPDVLLLTLDTLREDALSASPDALVPGLTPHLDALAHAGCRVDGATAPAPLTGPSHAALLSGRSAHDLGLLLNARQVPETPGWLADAFAEASYQTAAFVSSAMLRGDLGYARGFDVYDDDLGSDALRRRALLGRLGPVAPPRARRPFARPGAATVDRMTAWLDGADPDRPVFVWLHLYDAHRPYWPSDSGLARVPEALPGLPPASAYAAHPARQRDEAPELSADEAPVFHRIVSRARAGGPAPHSPLEVARRYLGGVADLDDRVGAALAEWAEARGGQPGAWAVVSDHGESLTEHDEVGSHQHHLYEANLRVPLLLSPGPCPTGPLSIVGLGGTLLERAGLPPGALPTLDTPLPIEAVVRGRGHGPEAPREPKLARREGDLKVVAGGNSGATEAYDLSVDPDEITPLVDAPDDLRRRTLVDARALGALRPETAEANEADRAALEALGYIDPEVTPQ